MTVLVNILLYTELLEKKRKKQLQINPSQHPEKKLQQTTKLTNEY
jgi:hypothetical protein